MALIARLARLEAHSVNRARTGYEIRVFWDDELVECRRHPDCMVEHATGDHHTGVLRLQW